jgi:ribosomal protein RSM22 (predicted rRNA methylase)
MSISRREERAARAAEQRWSVKWTKWERKHVELAIYAAKKTFPTASDAYLAQTDAHALEIVKADIEASIERWTQWHANALESVASVRADLERAVAAGHRYKIVDEGERLRWHERGAKQKAQNIARARKLLAKLNAHGLPAGVES